MNVSKEGDRRDRVGDGEGLEPEVKQRFCQVLFQGLPLGFVLFPKIVCLCMQFRTFGLPVLFKRCNARSERRHEVGVAEVGGAGLLLLFKEPGQELYPDVAVVHIAEIVLKILYHSDCGCKAVAVQTAVGLHGVAEFLCGYPHLMVRSDAFGVGEGFCIQFHLFCGEADRIVGGVVGGGGGGLGPVESAADDDLHAGFLEGGQGFGLLKPFNCTDDVRLECGSLLHQPQGETLNSGELVGARRFLFAGTDRFRFCGDFRGSGKKLFYAKE